MKGADVWKRNGRGTGCWQPDGGFVVMRVGNKGQGKHEAWGR
jgi:hypothetical protein